MASASIAYILSQSLSEGRTGIHLLRFLEDLPGTDGHLDFKDVTTRDEFIAAIRGIKDMLVSAGKVQVPLLHLEAHGNHAGLQMASGEFVYWFELKDLLTEINTACQLNLFVAISACHGESLVRIVKSTERAPVWGCLGPRHEISGPELLDCYKKFYGELLAAPDLRRALDAMGGGMPWDGKQFTFWPVEFFFLQSFRKYVEQEGSDQRLSERLDWISEQIRLSHGGVEISESVRSQLAEDLRDHKAYFDKFLRTFLMLDLYPHIRPRFQIDSSYLNVNDE